VTWDHPGPLDPLQADARAEIRSEHLSLERAQRAHSAGSAPNPFFPQGASARLDGGVYTTWPGRNGISYKALAIGVYLHPKAHVIPARLVEVTTQCGLGQQLVEFLARHLNRSWLIICLLLRYTLR
jgi:hypothetical protein